MNKLFFLCGLSAALTSAMSAEVAPAGTCQSMRFAYADFEVHPYVLGKGADIPPEAGAAIDFVRFLINERGNDVSFTRLPNNRIRAEVLAGKQHAAFVVGANNELAKAVALPMTADHQIDVRRSLKIPIYLYVRKEDVDAASTNTMKRRVLGVPLGSYYQSDLLNLGWQVEEGARDPQKNLEKLVANRFDGVAGIGPGLDKYIAEHPEMNVVRISKPIYVSNTYIMFNRGYYSHNRNCVEAIWDYIGARGQEKFDGLVMKYNGRLNVRSSMDR